VRQIKKEYKLRFRVVGGHAEQQVRTQNFSLLVGGSDPEATYNICLILKIML
jgi:putative aminopeptidase FrvX